MNITAAEIVWVLYVMFSSIGHSTPDTTEERPEVHDTHGECVDEYHRLKKTDEGKKYLGAWCTKRLQEKT